MAALIFKETLAASTRRNDVSSSPYLSQEAQDVDEQDVEDVDQLLVATRRVVIAPAREAMDELRSTDPKLAERLDAALVEMPGVGDIFVGFKLVHELGRGAFGRVFLAQQRNLADRLVALKIAVDLNGESQRLAQLQHTNIVPIYSEHRSGTLHAFCMPYCGSITLADVCKNLSLSQAMPTSGKQLVSTLCNRLSTVRNGQEGSLSGCHSTAQIGGSDSNPSLNLLVPSLATVPENLTKMEQMSYVDAILWMASRLADGLAHAHERGIIHRDMKPANVLLCDDGQPMLLDFNLSEDVKRRSSVEVAHVGGTLPYMAPEQLKAFRDGAGEVDGRGDIYALGLVVYHLLTGRHAFPLRKGHSKVILPQMIEDRQGDPPTLRQFNRAISPTVEAIVRRCLEADPSKRYASARHLAEDIELHRADLPLKHTTEPSLPERAAKWARRHPKLASPTTLSFLIAAVMLVAISISVGLSVDARKAAAAREAEIRHEQILTHYQDFQVDYHLSQDGLTSDDPVQIKEGIEHGEKALREYGVLDKPDWIEQPFVKELSPSDRARLKNEVQQIALMIAQAVYFGTNNDDAGKAVRANEVAENHVDENATPVVKQQRAAPIGVKLDDTDRQRIHRLLENAAGPNVHARFLLACEHAAQGRYAEALTILDGVIVVEPNDFGAWFMKARCHRALAQDVEAIAAYGTAIALQPTYARAYVARAAINYDGGKFLGHALEDLNQALKLEPDLLEAHIERGLVLHALDKHKEALEDLDWALTRDNVPARVWFIRSLVRRAAGDPDGADRDKQRGLETEPADPISYVSRGVAKLETDPEDALADFIKAEQLYPRFVPALYNQAYVLDVKLKKPEQAIAVLDRLLERCPDRSKAFGYRAILLARTGKIDDAVAAARELIKMASDPKLKYRAACVFAIASDKKPELKSESLRALSSALYQGYGKELVDTDPDLDKIRNTTEFRQIASIARVMRYWNSLSAQQK